MAEKSTTTPNLVDPTAPVGKREPSESVKSAQGDDVLFTHQSPILEVKTIGPKRIAVGKASAFEVTIQNSGQVAADDTVVTIDFPQWADVLGSEESAGTTHLAASGQEARQLEWKIGRLEGNGREKLILRIVPRQNRRIDLAVKWSYGSIASEAVIEVQEPKVSMQLDGPREVLFGKKELFKLELANTGNGDAENVMITLAPIGPGENPPATHGLGTLAAGEKKGIEIEVTARQLGSLTVQVELRGDNGVRAELTEKILVRRAELQVAVEGPKVQFVGSQVTYRIHLSNQGNAPAKNLKITATIPPGAKYISSDPISSDPVSSNRGGQVGADQRKVTWGLDTFAPGAEQVLLLKCHLGLAGPSRLEVLSTAAGELTASGTAVTQVEAMADLALDVSDPAGPIPVGKDTVYELRIKNRGTTSAENVEVIAYFSQGIEPVTVEGGRHKIGGGQVVFDAIRSLPAGQNVVLKITARAQTAGNHVFRAEVYCKPLGSRLVGEETTFFYNTKAVSRTASNPRNGETALPTNKPLRTVDRRPADAASRTGQPTRAPRRK